MPGVLLVGGDAELRDAVRAGTRAAGVELNETAGFSAGLRALAGGAYAHVILAWESGEPDLELIARVTQEARAGRVVVAVRRAGARLMLEVTRAGAVELLTAPYSAEAVRRALGDDGAEGGGVPLREMEDDLVGESPELMEVFRTIGRVGATGASVLVTGESGTGKEVVAAELHRASGRSGAFVAVNCAAIPEDLLESELFGHERGAFTGAIARKIGRFERAHRGTIFLDEIGDMSLVLQAKILRVLQEREVERVGGEERIALDVRVIAATHRDLRSRIASGEFREDLFYRLAVVRLQLPPLRARGGDVGALAVHFAGRFAREHGRPVRAISRRALALLEAHPWPGNVRELRNVMERAVLLASGETLLPEHLELEAPGGVEEAAAGEVLPGYSVSLSLAGVEALHLREVLRHVDGHFGRAAELLGLHRNTVSRKAQEYGLTGSG